MARVRSPDRSGPARGSLLATERASARIRLRSDRVRRDRGEQPRRTGPRRRVHPHRAFRRERAQLMDALDGNAIAGLLVEAFGDEMTSAVGICATCGSRRHLAEYTVYVGGPGAVVRCRRCQSVVMVLVECAGRICVDAMGLSTLRPPGDPTAP